MAAGDSSAVSIEFLKDKPFYHASAQLLLFLRHGSLVAEPKFQGETR
jgi:hypothetical protein